ncbi:amidohydrolase family protein [Pseudonocardia sp. TRM90224]|uniref:amidohydrolase family protein n=1 Tax=Pseudonocardia sp. TRM90224 TaxID=2812678 RepID=UPI001E35EC41|nr:amidohydrolase family protein [Pseudonocardia sp. TRM90224]
MIIDVHAHWGPWFFTMDVARASVATMDRYGIDVSIVSATEAVIYDAPAGNRALAGVLDGQRLFGHVTVNPRRLADGERDLREYLPTGRFVGVKIHTDYTGSPLTSPQMREALTMVAPFGCPALVHTWGPSVLDLAQACLDIPGLRAIAGHMGADGHRFAIEAARSCDRLYLEPCWSHAPAGRIAQVVAGVDTRQLLFGTDSTLIDPASAFGAVAAAGLTREAKARIAWENAAALFTVDNDVLAAWNVSKQP